ncbi:class I SAM-dependent methyltransferase [Planotetraspora phitsanulokensis]|uniref:SAM-dependent methyltransferase n=1 Tax=Planotetraspora phitsanulokensis TaxID=575192 RepID=A0A8J3XGL2_9ACTN|nr:class I SAM-dependent methyltransferase [Planotetraspora phitsanulokensis]GII40265.1 SAM-dependent methyltransferase [Planotetraspora phitsanulokensis]
MTTVVDVEKLDQGRVEEFLGRVAVDSAAAFAGLSTSIGARLGLYKALAGAGWLTSERLAGRTGLNERYVREWLAVQVAGEYVLYDAETGAYLLPDEYAAVLADPDSPTYMIGAFTMLKPLYATEDALVDAYRTGEGVGWEEHGPELYEGVAAFFLPGYSAMLVQEWLPALDGVVEKLERGASVADVGCGFGHSTLLMAQAFPNSRFRGFDFHTPSIEAARREARERGLSDRVTFDLAAAQDFPGEGYDLITYFDCLHDLGDPGAAFRQAERTLAEDGACMVVEPNAPADPAGLINPIGRSFASASAVLCLPGAIAQNGPQALGNHAGEEALRTLAAEAGLRTWKTAAETLTNRIYDVRR